MAKETTIIFLYDTELLQKEEDDPNSAILYFYPTWVSDQQKTALCGQLMGTVRCLKSIWSMPKTVSLQTGKFYIIENDRYLLAVGSDRNIPLWVLDHRATLIYSLINFFHKDFVNLALIYQKEALSAKLYHIFDTYLKLMLFGGNIFSHIPMLDIPKSGSTVFMEAVAFLERCRDFPNALGGTVLYHNKVVATHLSPSTTKKIIFADPYRIKNPAEIVETNFELPFGVQLLQVYITNKEFCSLHETALESRCILQHFYSKKHKKSDSSRADDLEGTQDTSTSLLRRDTSLLFTSVAEEDTTSLNTNSEQSVIYRQNSQKRSRPNSLNLKSHNFDLNESKLNSKITPSYCGQKSVACTPMTESKIFIHQEPLSCLDKKDLSFEDVAESTLDQNNDLDHTLGEGSSERRQLSRKITETDSQSRTFSNQNMKAPKYNGTFPSDLTRVFFQSMRQKKPFRRCSSLVDLSEVIASISDNPVQYSTLKNKAMFTPKSSIKLKRSKTIHDPVFPIFRSDGLAASQYYFKERAQYGIVNEIITLDKRNGKIYSCMTTYKKLKEGEELKTELNQMISQKSSKNHRKSLTLPLKPLNINETHKSERKYSMGVQLTPLMNKLTMLAFEEHKKAGTGSTRSNPYGVTPNKETSDFTFKSKDNKKMMEEANALQKCVLFICGQQDVVLGLLLQEECSKDRETIDTLWELCTEHLPKLEKQVNYCLQKVQNVSAAPSDTELYSFLNIDSEWDTVKRGGPWDNEDLNNMSRLYGDFKQYADITDIFLRNRESVVYGHHFGSSQVFYHENTSIIDGLLQPNDAIGLVHHKARKRLERDQNIVLP